MNKKIKILIVEDERAIATGLTDVFLFHGYEVVTVAEGNEGLKQALTAEYDLVILDVMLPGMDGFSICNKIREQDREQPIVMLTAKTEEEDIIKGLTLGADDYISKPFSVQELVLRAEAVLRRSTRLKRQQEFLTLKNGLKIDTRTLQGNSDRGDSIPFSRREMDILEYLAAHTTQPVSRGELLEEVWGYRKASTIDTRTVDIHIAKIRKKIEMDPKDPQILLTIRGEGYQLLLAT